MDSFDCADGEPVDREVDGDTLTLLTRAGDMHPITVVGSTIRPGGRR